MGRDGLDEVYFSYYSFNTHCDYDANRPLDMGLQDRRASAEKVGAYGKGECGMGVAVLVDHWTGSMGEGLAILSTVTSALGVTA